MYQHVFPLISINMLIKIYFSQNCFLPIQSNMYLKWHLEVSVLKHPLRQLKFVIIVDPDPEPTCVNYFTAINIVLLIHVSSALKELFQCDVSAMNSSGNWFKLIIETFFPIMVDILIVITMCEHWRNWVRLKTR